MRRVAHTAFVLPAAVGAAPALASILDPASPSASAIRELSWWMFGGGALIAAFVTLLALRGWRSPRSVRPRLWLLGGGVVFPLVVLFGLYAWSLALSMRFTTPPMRDLKLVTVIAHSWWWEVRYRHPASGREFRSANEVRIPVGRPVVVGLTSRDVIHSFWVPRLGGKVDMLPGRFGQLTLQADSPGVYRGQCAEFCGEQHARMAFHVIAMAEDEYDAWLARESASAVRVDGARAMRGRDAFVELRCGACHAVRGVAEGGELGPDLTHVASRRHLAAGTRPLDAATLRAWIADPQAIKPGARMPSYDHVDGQVLDDLAHYLSQLR